MKATLACRITIFRRNEKDAVKEERKKYKIAYIYALHECKLQA